MVLIVEVRKFILFFKYQGEKAGNGNGPKVRRIVGTTKSDKKVMEKGELMFGNEDAMEVFTSFFRKRVT